MMGYSRESFYRLRQLYEKGGEAAVQEISRGEPNLNNRIAPEIEQAGVKRPPHVTLVQRLTLSISGGAKRSGAAAAIGCSAAGPCPFTASCR
ncbi:MAG: hypothetical protein KatS3mg077_2548 [Candidatus Binatia bacterium]|nr:MAG: hypothetical protein KatS3mg077_2548 [Candidatus Binatia bacterium]